MKKFMFLFLVVAFVAVMAGGAMAVEIDCCPPPCGDCPPVCNGDTELQIDWTIYGLHCIDIQTEYVELCGWVPCEGTMESCCEEFDYEIINTGCPGTVYAWMNDYIPGANVWVNLDGCPVIASGPEMGLGETNAVEVYATQKNECRSGSGGVMMEVFPVADCGCGTVYLYFKITADQPVCP